MTEAVLTEADITLSQAEIEERSSKLRESLIDSLSTNPLYTKAAVESDVLGRSTVEWAEKGISYRLRSSSFWSHGKLVNRTEIEVDTPDSRNYERIPWMLRPGRVTLTHEDTSSMNHSSHARIEDVYAFETKAPAPEVRVYKDSAIAFEKAKALLAPILIY